MKGPGAILLVACYELGHQPLGIAWPAAFLERRGYQPAVMDLSVEPFDAEKVRRAGLVAISVPMHTALRLGVVAAARVRELNPTARVGFYGLYAQLNADHLRAHGADFVLGGEIEAELVRIVEQLEAGDRRAGGGGPRLEKLDFPVPSRAALPSLKTYAHLAHEGRLELVAHVEASRGCLHRCRHCPIPPVYDGRFFVVPPATVRADVRQQVAAGATHVSFGDPDFLNGPGHALRVARDLHREFPAVTFDFTAKIEHLLRHRDRLRELRALGCLFVVSAAESLDDAVLGYLDKGHTRADIVAALGLARAAGIALRPTWVAFTPWTTLDGYRDWLDFIEAEGLIDAIDSVQYTIRLLVPPGSLLVDHPAMRPYLGELVEDAFSYRWSYADPRLDALQEAVTAAVGAALEGKEDDAQVFGQVRVLADRAAGVEPRPAPAATARPRPPHLTEPWFC